MYILAVLTLLSDSSIEYHVSKFHTEWDLKWFLSFRRATIVFVKDEQSRGVATYADVFVVRVVAC